MSSEGKLHLCHSASHLGALLGWHGRAQFGTHRSARDHEALTSLQLPLGHVWNALVNLPRICSFCSKKKYRFNAVPCRS